MNGDAALAGIDTCDRYHPAALRVIGLPPLSHEPAIAAVSPVTGAGAATPLSRHHARWELIDRAATATRKPCAASEAVFDPSPLPPLASVPPNGPGAVPAASLIRRRRSAVDFDGRTPLDA